MTSMTLNRTPYYSSTHRASTVQAFKVFASYSIGLILCMALYSQYVVEFKTTLYYSSLYSFDLDM